MANGSGIRIVVSQYKSLATISGNIFKDLRLISSTPSTLNTLTFYPPVIVPPLNVIATFNAKSSASSTPIQLISKDL